MLPDIGLAEIAVVLLIALAVIGPKQLPEAAQKLGIFVRNVRTFIATIRHEWENPNVAKKPSVKDHE